MEKMYFLSDFERWLEDAEEEDKFMGLDLEYMANVKDVAVIDTSQTYLLFQTLFLLFLL